ncbi:phage tail sheath family protein [Paraburkholderia youngii]|uniref:phage tail sheath family protein n=1 Tax=Paraburkholderia youngii TaxID=2782701 RepID=UPI003D1E8003
MPVALTYPGVYVEEIPSGVHTITGVSTSVTAFIGYTAKGRLNEPAHIFSFAEYVGLFGDLAIDSPVSFAVWDFFQNGGNEAWVVRVAAGAKAASVTLLDKNKSPALLVTALSEGALGNLLQIDIDYDSKKAPGSLFNMTVTQYVTKNGRLTPDTSEPYLNLTLNDQSPGFAELVVNHTSNLIRVQRLTPSTGAATSTSAPPDPALVGNPALTTSYRVGYMLDGAGAQDAVVALPTVPAGATVKDTLTAVGTDIMNAINAQSPPGVSFALVNGDTQMQFTAVTDASHLAQNASIVFVPASDQDVTDLLKLGVDQGGVEVDGSAEGRPMQTGTVNVPVTLAFPTPADGQLDFTLESAATGKSVASGPLYVWGVNTTVAPPGNLDELIAQINAAFTAASSAQAAYVGAYAQRIGKSVRIVPGPTDPNLSFSFTGALATELGIDGAANGGRNIARYAPGLGRTAFYQKQGAQGKDGTEPQEIDLTGNALKKTGLYALEKVDLFNLLVIPEASTKNGKIGLLIKAIDYCQRRRAFMIIDAPEAVSTFAQAQTWVNSGDFAALRSRNCAIYFPRYTAPHPLKQNIVQPFAAAGALAGIYATTDANRGVWKAPAGIQAVLSGATGLTCVLTNDENGALNPIGLNCLRAFPVIGTVAWGARTGRGADTLTDEYKYIPVRRLALYLEESLFRGTQWVVFEPNDEPLWAQIRLNLGAFMHTLFAQGAFQGTTPREAYFVKCDKETTTQNDIDLGVVNIVVGFAPLKPAEFVVIKIQQIAGALQV